MAMGMWGGSMGMWEGYWVGCGHPGHPVDNHAPA